MPVPNIMYKTLGSKWFCQVFIPASAFVTADSDKARNPQRFIHATVVRKKRRNQFKTIDYMKRVFVIILVLIQMNDLFSQINKDDLSFEIRYPIPTGNNFLNKAFGDGYSGIVDFGVDYNVLKINNIGIGVLLNSSFLRLPESDMNLMILSPKLKIDYKINFNNISIVPNLAVGYSNWRFRATVVTQANPIDPVQKVEIKENYNGISYRGAAKIVWNNNKRLNWYAQLAYEFTRLEEYDNSELDSNYNRNMHVLYPGIGLIWKFNKE